MEFGPFDIYFAEVGCAVAADELVEGVGLDLELLVPDVLPPLGVVLFFGDPTGINGGEAGVAAVVVEGDGAFLLGDDSLEEGDGGVAAVLAVEEVVEGGLGFDGDDGGTELAPDGEAVAEVGADVEAEGVGGDEGAVEAAEAWFAPRDGVGDEVGAGEAEPCGEGGGEGHGGGV